MLTPAQLAAALALLRWTVDDLADASNVSRHTAYAFLSRPDANPTMKTLQAWIGALHKAGVILLDEDDAHGVGVRLRKGAKVKGAPPRARGRRGRST
jgi:transcriptional regulator with XRE-family HTH domain